MFYHRAALAGATFDHSFKILLHLIPLKITVLHGSILQLEAHTHESEMDSPHLLKL